MVKIIKGLADELCDSRLVLCLEGGYHLKALATSIKATLDILLGNSRIEDPLGQPVQGYRTLDISPLIKAIKGIHKLP